MFNPSRVSTNGQINDFLLKVAKEYNIIDKSSNRNYQMNNVQSVPCQSLISTGWFSTLFSNNQINMHSNQESQKDEKKKQSPNYLGLLLVGSATAIFTGFGLGRLRKAIVTAEENISYTHNIQQDHSLWGRNRNVTTVNHILDVVDTYQRVEIDRKSKLSDYQLSLIGVALGIGISIVGASISIELLAAIGIITAVASATFAAYQVASHWDDFTRAQDKFKELHLLDLIVDLPKTTPFQTSAPFQPPHCNSAPSAPGWKPFVFATPSYPPR